MQVTLLTAWDENRLIGNGSGLPWFVSEDLKLFKIRTHRQTVVFGLKTYMGLPYKPLPRRVNAVVMFKEEYENFKFPRYTESSQSYVIAAINGVKEAINLSKRCFPDNEIFICGGASIYKQALEQDLVDRMLVSVIPGEHEGDVYFPEFSGIWNRHVVERYNEFYVEEWIKDEK
jgi:dihydrofolate reductase